MSIAQGTLHYDYPQVQLTDRPTFADFNSAFADIDAKLYSLITDSSTIDGRVDALETSMVTAQNDIAGLRTDVNLANAGVATNAEAITALQATVGSHTTTLKTKLDSVAVADAYDSEHGTYSVGDIVTYNGQRYKCITAVTAAEPFDADKWQGEDIQAVLDDVESDLSNLNTALSNLNATSTCFQTSTEIGASYVELTFNVNTNFATLDKYTDCVVNLHATNNSNWKTSAIIPVGYILSGNNFYAPIIGHDGTNTEAGFITVRRVMNGDDPYYNKLEIQGYSSTNTLTIDNIKLYSRPSGF